MGYPSVDNFDKVFVARTLENLNQQVPNTFTHLLNSLLGLIILPRQWNIQGKRELEFLDKPINVFEELNFLNEETYYSDDKKDNIKIKKLECRHIEKNKLTVKILLNRLRSSVAHQAIRPTKDGDNWCGVIFRNYSTENRTAEWGNNYDLQMYLTESELKLFAEFISKNYLAEILEAK